MDDNLWQQVFNGTSGAIFADSVHFPFAVVAVDFCHDLRGMRALGGQRIAGDFVLELLSTRRQ